ncbi:hypothetical protein QTN47_12345 [Danxiaibacter flavus]|uniref:CCDC81-like prokaryotic HU domain-containing protein n=1 Tax=Danxiaibacter flavus TaxID=3049108 RepID=A0ABV3ZIP3_9BACT|nr:hypothetical protein QNM32_12350 [Chitinophagaceae bacterium DXS]
MTKYDALIHEFLLENKHVSLEKLGEFVITGEPFVTESGTTTSQPKIEFTFNKYAETSPELIEYIATKLGKNRSIAGSGVESYLIEAKQWINIGKSYSFEGIGEIIMDNSANLQFRQMAHLSAREEEFKRKRGYAAEAGTIENRQSRRTGVFALAIIIVLLIVAGIGYGIYNYINSHEASKSTEMSSGNNATEGAEKPATPVDTAIVRKPATVDTTATVTTIAPPATDSARFKFIFEVTGSRDRAVARTAKLREYGDHAGFDSLKTDTAMRYRLYIDATVLQADTLRAIDSLTKYFGRTVYMRRFQ